ncbi:MAG: hypothetical protein ACK4X1_04380 [Terricaulis sp.]
MANLARLLRKPWLRLSSAPEWRSWIAALCVALAAFATLEQVSPAHASDICTNVAMSVTASEPVAAAESVQDDQGPPSDQQQQQRHHCCGAHNNSAPPLAHAGVPVRLAESLTPSHRSDAELDHTPSGLERPPKLTAIA